MTNTLFINEQHSHLELRREFISSEQAVWVPISNRHCCWTFEANPYGRLLWGLSPGRKAARILETEERGTQP